MLFIADRHWPNSSSQTFFREARVDKSIIRIKSAHKWPERIIIDTSLPTIASPLPLPVAAKGPGHQSTARSVCPSELAVTESLGISHAG